MFFISLTILLFLLYALLFLYYSNAWKKIPEYHPSANMHPQTMVSVIISARNEEERIGKCLESLALQNYPPECFEVIVINDFSEDNTSQVVRSFSAGFPQLRLIELSDFVRKEDIWSYKKKAIETGISQAKGTLIITTDADCVMPRNWISTIAAFRNSKEAGMIAAPVALTIPSGSKSSKLPFFIFQIIDFMTMQGITGAALHKRFHYMANGANFAYTKKLFHDIEGYKEADDIPSGDDMMLIEKASRADQDKIYFLKSAEAIVCTPAEPTLKSFFHQRVRWASKSSKYQDYKIKTVLALVYLANAWLVIVALSAFVVPGLTLLLLAIFVIKVLAELLLIIPVSRFFDQTKLLWWFVPLQPFHILYILFAGWFGAFGSYRWKGRRVTKSGRMP